MFLRLFFAFVIALFIVSNTYAITLYSYQPGNWNDPTTWTTDPGGTTLVGSQVPSAGDMVVILSSRTVTLTADITATGLSIVINSGGVLSMGTFSFINPPASLSGSGTLRLQSVNFPAAAFNTFVNAGGGTCEYINTSGTLTQTAYNHLKILKTDDNAASYTLTANSDIVINGNIEITRTQGTGNVIFTVGNSTSARNITINGNFELSEGALVNTGLFNAIHNIELRGDLINYGSVDLSNSNQYVAATNGAAVLTFSGESDNMFHCEGTTDIYRMILDKGTDRTFVLTVTSGNSSYFRLFGPVSATGGDYSTLPLVLQNGTLRLRSAVNIDALGKNTESGDIREFHVPATAGFWIDGANVSTSDDGGSWRGITVYGLLRITSGTFTNPDNTGGITYFGNISQPGYILLEGGTINTTQIKQADANGRVTYHQTGGSLRITGSSDSRGSSAVFAMPEEDFVFIMSGGSIYIAGVNTTATNGIDIRAAVSNCNVTGGTVTIVRPSATDDQTNFSIYSTAPFYNLTLKDTSASGANRSFILQNDLEVLNDLAIRNRTLNAANFNVSVGGDFTITAGATYTPGTNKTVFNGSGNQTFTGNGTITSGFYKLGVDKPSGTITLAGTPGTYTIRDSLLLVKGTLDDGGKTIDSRGHIYVAGNHTGTGKIQLNGAARNIKFEVFGEPSLGNVELNNASGATMTNNGTVSSFRFAVNSLMTIGRYRLTVSSGSVTNYSSARYFRTDGVASNGGLRLAVNAATLTTGNNLVFPIGVTGKYTPATIMGASSPGSGTGYVTFIPVNSVHPSEKTSGQHLNYYWRSIATGMPSGSNVYYVCTNSTAADWESAVKRAYSLISGTSAWNEGANNTANEPNVNLNNVPNSRGFVSADITAGNPGAFNNIDVFYSIKSGEFSDKSTWSKTGHTGDPSNQPPSKASDIIFIGGDAATSRNDSIWVTTPFNVSSITINGSYTGDGRMPVLNIQDFGASTVDIIKGDGKFTTTTTTIPNADYGEFVSSSSAIFNYEGASYTLGTTLTRYPNLLITSSLANRTKTLPNANIAVNGDLIIASPYSGNTLRFNAAGGNLLVYGDIKMTNGANLHLTSDIARELTVYGNIDFRYLDTDNGNNLTINVGSGQHKVNFYGDSIIMGQSSINLTNGILNFYNTGNTVVTDRTGGSGNITLNRLVVEKGLVSDIVTINHPLTLTGSTNSSPKALELVTGTLELDNSNINLILSSGGADFVIPQTAALVVKGSATVNVTGTNTGIYLDGLLRAQDDAVVNLGNGSTADNRYIEYSASGNASIELADNASLTVNTQIRRSVYQTSGVLKYNQGGNSTATIYGQSHNPVRAKLEITNSGSEFTMAGGNIILIRDGGTTFGDLYLRPASSSVTGGTITFGTVNTGVRQFSMDANIALNNLTVNGTGVVNALNLTVNPLELNGDFTLENSNSIFNTNDIDVTVKGNFINNGTYNAGTNITTLSGSTQNIQGTSETSFFDLVAGPSESVTLANNIRVNNTLTINAGEFNTSMFNVNAKGNVINNGLCSGDEDQGGIILNGTLQQLVSGSGTFGRLELDNSNGARLLSSISLQHDFVMTSGIMDINQHLLNLGAGSDIAGSGFGPSKMIQPDGVYSNVGIRKTISPVAGTTFLFPIGTNGKYTPAELTIIDNASTGSVRINAINDHHPTVTDAGNVLQYYWEIASSGMTSFEGNIHFTYTESDVAGDEDDYIAARLVVPPGVYWSKAAPGALTDNVNETGNIISFDFPAGTTNLGGEYTAGTDAAIPDEVPVYTSINDGDWDDINIWSPVAPSGGPNGFIVIISPGDSVSTNGNRRFAYRTTINGTLYAGTTYGHNLGSVDGTGKLFLEGPVLPAGRFTEFLSCSGGTLEYGGAGTYAIIADRIDTVRNLYFTGTGERILPDKDLVICQLLKIEGPHLNNGHNRKLTLFGDIQRLGTGTFSSGSGAGATVVFKGNEVQHAGGMAGNFTGSNAFNNLEINNESGLMLDGPMDLKGNLLLTAGNITTNTTDILTMLTWNASVTPAGGSSASFVNGPFRKYIWEGDNFTFPTGKSTRYGKTAVSGAGRGTWLAEYHNSGYADLDVTAPLVAVSTDEYWHIAGPAGKQAFVGLRWDTNSDITPLTTNLADIRVAEFGAGSWIEKATNASGDDYNGTAVTAVKMNLDEHDYTLGSVSAIKPRANFTSTDDACVGDILYVAFTNTSSSYIFEYKINNGSAQQVTTSSNPYPLTTTTAGRYRLTAFTGGVVDTNSVVVSPLPTADLESDDSDNIICEGESVTFTASGGSIYSFFVDGASVQSGASATYTTTGLIDGSVVYVVVTNSNGCSDQSDEITFDVNSRPEPVISGLDIVCTDAVETYTTESLMVNYVWTVTGGAVTDGGGPSDNYVTVTWGDAGTGYVNANYENSAGCNALTDTELEITIYRKPETGPLYHIPDGHYQ